jgi:hypothetical protein
MSQQAVTPQQKQVRGFQLLANIISSGQGNPAAKANLAQFRADFQARHGGMTAAQMNASRTGGPASVTGA